MVFKRKVAAEPQPATDDVKLVDELVKKSLTINPEMRRGRDTRETIDVLRAEAMGELSKEELDELDMNSGHRPVSEHKYKDPRLQTLVIFLRQKAAALPQAFGTLKKQRLALNDDYRRKLDDIAMQERTTRAEAIAGVVDMLRVLMASGAQPRDCQKTLADFHDFLALLSIKESDLVRMAQTR